MDHDAADYCWCGSRVQYMQTLSLWLCYAHGYQEQVYGPTPPDRPIISSQPQESQ